MLKILLSFVSILVISVSNAQEVTFEGKRIYLWINPNKKENDFLSGPYNITFGSKDTDINWSREIQFRDSDKEFTLLLKLIYNEHDQLSAPSRSCANQKKGSKMKLAQDFFQIMVTGAKIKDRCPVGDKSPSKCPGEISAKFDKVDGVHCNVETLVSLSAQQHREVWSSKSTETWQRKTILKIVYAGRFSGC